MTATATTATETSIIMHDYKVSTDTAKKLFPGTVEREFIKGLKAKNLDTMVFFHEANNINPHDNGVGRIRLNFREYGSNIEAQMDLPVRSYIRTYGEFKYDRASFCVLGPRFGEAHMLANMLKVGDEVELEWLGDNRNENQRGVDWTGDELRLKVHRKDKYLGSFLIGYYVGPDNSARMMTR